MKKIYKSLLAVVAVLLFSTLALAGGEQEISNSLKELGSEVSVYSSNGTIIVENAEEAVIKVYSISGKLVEVSKEGVIEVPAGIYLVQVGKTVAQKVIVK